MNIDNAFPSRGDGEGTPPERKQPPTGKTIKFSKLRMLQRMRKSRESSENAAPKLPSSSPPPEPDDEEEMPPEDMTMTEAVEDSFKNTCFSLYYDSDLSEAMFKKMIEVGRETEEDDEEGQSTSISEEEEGDEEEEEEEEDDISEEVVAAAIREAQVAYTEEIGGSSSPRQTTLPELLERAPSRKRPSDADDRPSKRQKGACDSEDSDEDYREQRNGHNSPKNTSGSKKTNHQSKSGRSSLPSFKVYNEDYEYTKHIATLNPIQTSTQTKVKLSNEPHTFIPQIHPEYIASCRAEIQRYQYDNFSPNRNKCVICVYGSHDETEESNWAVKQFFDIYLDRRNRGQKNLLWEDLANHWNKEMYNAFTEIGIRNDAKVSPGMIEYHFTRCIKSPCELIDREIRDISQLVRTLSTGGLFMAEMVYGQPTGVMQVAPSHVGKRIMLSRQLKDLILCKQSLHMNELWLAKNGVVDPDAHKKVANNSYSSSMNNYGRMVLAKRNEGAHGGLI